MIAFSFHRTDKVEEFLSDFSEDAVNFAADYYFSGEEACGTKISPSQQAGDDLSISELEVGKTYSYCVRAVAEHYMDAPFALTTEDRLLTSSLSTCDAHKILFEAKINGLVTTEPNAGSLPIEDVLIEWELLGADNTTVLSCNGCSGEERTSEGGSFHIKIKADDEFLYNKNDNEIALRYKLSKSTFTTDDNGEPKEIQHVFLCNEGQEECNSEGGDVTYISHLNFVKSLHIYDDTSVPFSGRIIHDGTRSFDAPDGCPIVEAEVCLMHNSTTGVEEELVCVESDRNGEYVAPVVIGSLVQGVKVSYNQHDFEKDSNNDFNYDKGIRIEADKLYIGHDFADVTKARLFIEGKQHFSHEIYGTFMK